MLKITQRSFGQTKDGKEVQLFSLAQGSMEVEILNLGGIVRSIRVPDRAGNQVDVALGFDTLEAYESQNAYLGALVGRYANRIAKGRFELGGKEYQLFCNDGGNHLHGGKVGFDRKIWYASATEHGLSLTLHSPDMEEGYPGNLDVSVLYSISPDHTLSISYHMTADKDTICNLTNHTYFNLAGHNSGSVERQKIRLFSSRYTVANKESLPTGEIALVEGTPMDLREPTPIGQRIDEPFEQLRFAGGYDHNWLVEDWDSSLRPMAEAYDEGTGIRLEGFTTMPGVQFYTANFLEGVPLGKGGAAYQNRSGFCLESQYYPNALAHPEFPQPVLIAGKQYSQETRYRFSII